MEEVLRSLAELLLKAIPTFILVVLLHFYLKRVYFGPMARVLAERRAATEGARQQAEASFARTEEKAAEYEAALKKARAELYREQEALRHQLRQQHAEAVLQARSEAQAMVHREQQALAAELSGAKERLRRDADALAEEIAQALLRRRTA